jgi:hypothetical protein
VESLSVSETSTTSTQEQQLVGMEPENISLSSQIFASMTYCESVQSILHPCNVSKIYLPNPSGRTRPWGLLIL